MIQGEGGGPGPPAAPGQLGLIGHIQNTQIIGDGLELAVAAADAGGTLAVVLRQDQLHIDPPGTAGPGGIGVDHHALLHPAVAGGDHGPLALYLHAAHAAGGDLVDVLQIAQVGNVDSRLLGGLQDGGALVDLDGLAVDGHGYHSVFLPPLKLPKP